MTTIKGDLIMEKENKEKAESYCGNERPPRKVLCQLKKGHKGSHRAVIFWEGEEEPDLIYGSEEERREIMCFNNLLMSENE